MTLLPTVVDVSRVRVKILTPVGNRLHVDLLKTRRARTRLAFWGGVAGSGPLLAQWCTYCGWKHGSGAAAKKQCPRCGTLHTCEVLSGL